MKTLGEKGFSLLEVMITGGLLCALAFGYMKFMDRQARSERGRRASAEADILHGEIRAYLGKPGSCTNSFKEQKLTSGPSADAIKKPNGKDKYVVGEFYGNRLIKLGSIAITNFETDTEDGLMGTGTLVILYEKQGKIVGGKNLKREINIDILVDENKTILECATIGNLSVLLDLGSSSDDSSSSADSSAEDSSSSSNSSSSASSASGSTSSSTTNSGSSANEGTSSGTQSSTSSSNNGNEAKKDTPNVTANSMQKYLDGTMSKEDKAKVDAVFKSNKALQQLRDSVKAMQKQNSDLNKMLDSN